MQSSNNQEAHLSLKERLLFKTQNLGDASEHLSEVFGAHLIKSRDRAATVDTYFYHAPMVTSSISYLGFGSPTSTVLGELKNYFLVEMPVSGYTDIHYGSQVVRATPNSSVVISPSENTSVKNSKDCWKILVKIDRSAVERYLSGLLGRVLTHPIEFDITMDLSRNKTWYETVKYVTDRVVHLNPGAGSHQFLSQLEQLLISALLHSQPHTYSDALISDKPNIAPHHVRLAEEYMAANFAEDISLQDLAQISGVSVAALCQGFQKFRGISPIKFLKIMRLEHAYEALLNATSNARVTEISQDCGFRQSGRFSVEFKKRFGQSPSDVLYNLEPTINKLADEPD